MPFSISDMTKKDETAEKIPTNHKGLRAFFCPTGYASILCFPVTIWQVTKDSKESVPRMKEARQRAADRILEETWEEDKEENKQRQQRAKLDAREREGLGPQGPPREKKVPDTEPMDPKLERDPENPRVCDAECPNFGKGECLVHGDRKPPSQPTSPGLLAI